MSYFTIRESMWGEALMTTMYILNMFLNKSISQTLFKLRTGRKLDLKRLSYKDKSLQFI